MTVEVNMGGHVNGLWDAYANGTQNENARNCRIGIGGASRKSYAMMIGEVLELGKKTMG
jgi:hypothetical protein